MKKFIAYLILFLLMSVPTWSYAATYYAQGAGAIESVEWDTTPTGGGTDLVWDNIQAADILYANNNAITVGVDFTAGKISTAAGAGTAGGSFTTSGTRTLVVSVEAGAVPGLILGGNLTITSTTITGGTASSAYGISQGAYTLVVLGGGTITGGGTTSSAFGIAHTSATGTTTIGTAPAPFALVGGSGSAAFQNAGAGAATIYASVTGGTALTAQGVLNQSTGAVSITGTVKGGTHGVGVACLAAAAPSTGVVTVTGNIDNSGAAAAINCGSALEYTPAASNYVFYSGGTDVYVSKAPAKDKVLSDTSVVISTTGAYEAGTASGGGGGAWAN
jgi:hypothetical protein